MLDVGARDSDVHKHLQAVADSAIRGDRDLPTADLPRARDRLCSSRFVKSAGHELLSQLYSSLSLYTADGSNSDHQTCWTLTRVSNVANHVQLAFALDMSSISAAIVSVVSNLVALRQPSSHVCQRGFHVPVAGTIKIS